MSLKSFLHDIGYKADKGLLETADKMYVAPIKVKGERSDVLFWGDINATTQAAITTDYDHGQLLAELQMRNL